MTGLGINLETTDTVIIFDVRSVINFVVRSTERALCRVL